MKELLYVCECILMAVTVFEVINWLDTLEAECVFFVRRGKFEYNRSWSVFTVVFVRNPLNRLWGLRVGPCFDHTG